LREIEVARTRVGKTSVTTVPAAVRRILKLDWGDEISWLIKGENIVIVKAKRVETR